MPILEHEYHPVDYRNVCDLRKVSYAARALYLELFCAAGKTKHGVVDVRPALLEDESGIPASQIPALVVELVTAGLIAHDAKNRLAYHVGSALRHCYNPNIRTGWTRIVGGLPAGPVKMAFESELAGVAWSTETVSEPLAYGIGTVSEPLSNRFDNSNGNSNSNDNRNGNDEPSVAKATDTSATAAEAGAIAIEPQEPPKQTRYKAFDADWKPGDRTMPPPNPLADTDEDPALDQSVWKDIKPTNPALLNSDYRPQSKLLPHLQHKLAVKDAVAKGILLPEQEQAQLAMDLPAGKTRKPLSDTQLDAIFAKRKMLEICNHWNAVMAGKNAPCVPKSIMAKAGTLMANVARFEHREPLEDARWLFDWAMAIDPYHSGRQGKPWTLQAWLSADHLSAVFAAYRTHKGDSKQYTLDLDRTIRDWRLAVETAELNNKIAAQREAA